MIMPSRPSPGHERRDRSGAWTTTGQELTTRRAKALCGAGECAHRLGHLVARLLVEESVVIYRKLGDKGGLIESLGRLGMILHRSTQNSVTATRTLLEKSLMLAREVGDDWILANMLFNLGTFMYDRHDFKNARLFWEESVTLYRELQDHHALSHALHALAELTVYEGGVTQAAALAQESLALARELNNGPNISRALYCLAIIQSMQVILQLCHLSPMDWEHIGLTGEYTWDFTPKTTRS